MSRLKLLYLAALLLPTVFLGVESARHLWHRTHAPAYTVAVEGYDPRDLVYGEYLQFRLLWDDPASEKPENKKDLPEVARLYLSEGNARDLQTMLWEKKNRFTARVSLMGKKALVRDFSIDGKSWPEGLAAWRQNRDNAVQ